MDGIVQEKKRNSQKRISELRNALSEIDELRRLTKLTVFVAGSYARNEASLYSDIDLFFVYDGHLRTHPSPNINSLRAFAKIIEEADRLNFPAFSNDGEFLKILEFPEMSKELGGRNDDYLNYFTARMLMLLESTPVYNANTYEHIKSEIVASYFRDYTHHPKEFLPIFLINDIIRFWKTLCLNYENKRNQPESDLDRKIKQKIKNFKLKFSRMLTCFGSIASITNLGGTCGPDQIIQLSEASPIDRLQNVAYLREATRAKFHGLYIDYTWFLEVTNVSEADLIQRFQDKKFREEAFRRAESFGDALFEIVLNVASETGYLRYLVI